VHHMKVEIRKMLAPGKQESRCGRHLQLQVDEQEPSLDSECECQKILVLLDTLYKVQPNKASLCMFTWSYEVRRHARSAQDILCSPQCKLEHQASMLQKMCAASKC
jgi:hypothetical protein